MPRNRRETEIRERKIRIGVVTSCAVLGLLGIIACGYGHAAFSSDLMISGEGTVLATQSGFNVDYMQDLTPEMCKNSPARTTSQMIDKRDGRVYWITKVGSYCLMTQDLKFDLIPDSNGKIELTSELSDINYSDVAGYEEEEKNGETIYKWNENSNYPPTETQHATSSWPNSASTTYSLNFGEYVPIVIYPASVAACPNTAVGPSACPNQALAVGEVWEQDDDGQIVKIQKGYSPTLRYVDTGLIYDEDSRTYDAHFVFGNYYQYMTATAGSGQRKTSSVAASSICPKGWGLPDSGMNQNQYLVGALEDANAFLASNLRQVSLFNHPTYVVQAGRYVTTTLQGLGYNGYMRMNSFKSGTNSNVMTNAITGGYNSYYGPDYAGNTVRCVLREVEEE